mgnify:CR=1 FL=1
MNIGEKIEDYYLIVGRQTAYKRTDLAIAAFNQLGFPLKVIGTGPALKKWMLKAKGNIEFLGRLSDKEVAKYLAGCKALIMSQEEDAGIVPLEAMASGRPVIAYKSGGATETVIDGVTGIFFAQQTTSSLVEGVKKFAGMTWQPNVIREHALKFGVDEFKQNIKKFVEQSYEKYHEIK